uniref:Alkylated DNA repair protein alkB 8 n=1 Tax=Lygus hesperus TaxID=30085 RepID=A0A146KP40_LYGHE
MSFPNLQFVGCDASVGLLQQCHERSGECVAANVVQLPFAGNTFDAGICIAVLHHLATEERRREALCEILRTVRSGGRVFCTVWAREQDSSCSSRDFTTNDVLVPWNTPSSIAAVYGSCHEVRVKRYYHVFVRGELTNLCRTAGAADVHEIFDRGNWCVCMRKS